MGCRVLRQHRRLAGHHGPGRTQGRRGLSLELFVQAAPGLEPAVEAELDELGLDGSPETGGVRLEGDLDRIAGLNLRLACASRVLVTVGGFRATGLPELERKAATLDWTPFLGPAARIVFRVTCRKSRLYHTGAVAERLCRAAGQVVPGVRACTDRTTEEDGAVETEPAQRFIVRILRDQVTIRADASGAHLHRRGYRLATARAPLRENLAAGVLRLAGWRPERPLVDPLCGSGTFVIEAALRACGRAPGENRSFAFQRWPGVDSGVIDTLRAEALAQLRRPPAPLLGSDRDAGAVEAARANAERAGVAGAVTFLQQAVSEARPPAEPDGDAATEPGLLVANPPWGRRVGQAGALRDLHARLGQVARARFPGWTLALLSPSERLVREADRRVERIADLRSGGVSVGLWRVESL